MDRGQPHIAPPRLGYLPLWQRRKTPPATRGLPVQNSDSSSPAIRHRPQLQSVLPPTRQSSLSPTMSSAPPAMTRNLSALHWHIPSKTEMNLPFSPTEQPR